MHNSGRPKPRKSGRRASIGPAFGTSIRGDAAVFAFTPFPYIAVRADGLIRRTNEAAFALLGEGPHAGRDLRSYVVGEERAAFALFLEREFARGGGGSIETNLFVGTSPALPLRFDARMAPRRRELWLFARDRETERKLALALARSEIRCLALSQAADRTLAEEARRNGDRFLRLLYDVSPVGVFRADAEGNYMFVNERWTALVGIEFERARGRGWLSAVHSEDRGAVEWHWRACVEERRPFRLEYRLDGRNGCTDWVLCRAIPDMDGEGSIGGFVGTVLDIGDRKTAEAALAAQETRIEELVRGRTAGLEEARRRTALILDTLEEGVCEVNPRGKIDFANPAAARMLGIRPDALVGTHLHSIVLHDGEGGAPCPPGACPLCDAMFPDRGRGSGEAVLVRADGTSFFAEIGGSPLITAGRLIGTVVVFRDRTEARKSEEALWESESRFRRAIEAAALPISIHADDGSVELVNRLWTELTGYGAESLRTTTDWARLAYGGHSDEVIEELKQLYSFEGRGPTRQREITTKDGRKLIWEVSSATLDRLRGGKRTVITTAVDITERVAAEREAKKQQRLLIQSEKMASLGTLVAGVAHEINNPNHAISLNAGIIAGVWDSVRRILDSALAGSEESLLGGLEYGELRNEMPLLLKGMIEASEHIDSIVRGLKDFSRTEEDGAREYVQLNFVVNAAVNLLQSFLARSTLNFRLELSQSLPSVWASFHSLEQVVINLIQNACQALDRPSQAIVVNSSFDSASDRVRLVVRDEGRGMSDDELAHIRDPFFTTKRSEGGLGLGVPISVAIVESFGGSLEFESSPGEGTRAVVELPASVSNDKEGA